MIASSRRGHPLPPLLRRAGVPHVYVNRCLRGSGRNVRMADELAIVAGLDHLYALGHRRIGLIAGPEGNDPATRRAAGFRRHARTLGLELARVAEGDFTEAGGAKAARRLLRRDGKLIAIATRGLRQAMGALHAAWELGHRVPDDLSALTIDDLSLAEYLRPPLTSVRMPLGELGAAAVDAILLQLDGDDPRDVVVETRPEVVVRSSTARPAP